MKRTHFLSLLLCGTLLIGLASGCAETPAQTIVREKNGPGTERYKEVTSSAEAELGNDLSQRLQAPEIYQAYAVNEDASFQLVCNADVMIPDMEKIPVYKVSPKPFDQEWISQVTKAFFGDVPVYDGDSYFQTTKAEALEHLNELKGYQAEGNLDPYGLIASAKEAGVEYQEGIYIYNLQDDIDSWENTYRNAPESVEKTVVTPSLPESTDPDSPSNYFTGAVELDGEVYRYRLREILSSPMDIKISRITADSSGYEEWNAFMYCMENEDGSFLNSGLPEREKAEEMAGITPEQAIEMADQYMKKLGLTDFSAKNTILSLYISSGPFVIPGSDISCSDAGYLVSYTRDVDGFPVTDEISPGGEVEAENMFRPWNYEKVEFYVNGRGLQQAQILNLYQLEEQQLNNVELLSFPEIAEIFEQMAKNSYTDSITPGGYIKLEVTDVKLGYIRLYDPGVDSASGLLVPAWDFFGVMERLSFYDGSRSYYKNHDPLSSFLTLNAADGTIIERRFGY